MGGESGSCVCTGHQCHCRSSSRAQLLQRVPMGSWGCPCCATKAPARAPLGLQEVSPAPGGLPRAGIPHGPSKRQSSPGRAAQQTPKERVLFTSLALCVGRMVRVGFFCISAAISWGWEAAKWPRLVLSTAGTEQDTLPARLLRSLAPKGRN